MSRTRLNTSLLRRRSEPPRSTSSVSGSRNNLSRLLGGNDPVVSRRRMLGLTGSAVVGASPVLKGARVALSDGFGVAGDEKRLAFILGGKERWVIEPRRYGRGASLHLERNEKKIRLELRDAVWPGTDLPADFVAEITRGLTGSRLKLTADALRFRGTVSFESWLLGDATLRSSVRIDRTVTAIGADGALALHGSGSGEIGADGTLLIDGKGIARLALDGRQSLRADRVAVELLDTATPGLVESGDPHRTQIHLTRDDHDWMVRPAVMGGTGWTLRVGTNIFDRVTIEVGERSGGGRSAALLAEGEGAREIAFLPDVDGLHGGSSPQFTLPLDAPRYAVLHDGGSERSVLVADYPATPVTLRTEGMSLKLGRDATSGTFALVSEGSELRAFDCAPTLLAATLPLKGVVVQPTKPTKPTRLHFFRRENPHPKDAPTDLLPPDAPLPDEGDAEEGDVLIDPIKQGVVTFPLKSVIWVLRPADMLYLGFEFMNMKVSSGGSGIRGGAKTSIRNTAELKETQMRASVTWSAEEPLATQVRKVNKAAATITSTGSGTTKKPYLVVHFPPQNIAEQAFWETEPAEGADEAKPDNMVKSSDGVKVDGKGNEIPNLPPIQHRVAGPSRLAFTLPSGVTNIPYKLADMLDWSSLIPSVVPSALPPPPPPSKLIGSIMGISESMQGKIASQFNAGGRKSVIMSNSVSRFSSMRTMGDATQVTKHSIVGGYSGTEAVNSGQTKAIAAKAQVAADDASVKADPDQLMALATENAESKYGLYLDLSAAIPEIMAPKEYHTSIESPYRLIISPHIFSGWAHAAAPVTHDGKTELWHTRLGSRTTSGAVDEKDDYYRTIRAVWSPDFAPNPDNGPPSNNLPFRMSLNGRDRNELVHLSANYKYPKGTKWVPDHIDVERLMLSPLGAWMNVRGTWEPPAGLSIEEWKHRGTMGRDHYVRVVYKGFLFPFGNRASLVKVTERKIRKFGRHGYIAYMYQRMYIVVRKPIKEYPALGQPYDSRRTPFRRIRLATVVTPNLERPDVGISKIGSYGDEAFWPVVDGQDFLFNVVADDWEGNQIEFSTPLAFVNNTVAFDYATTTAVFNTYNANRRKRSVSGSKIAYAPSDKPGDTSFETEYVLFTVDVPTSDTKNTGAPNALPKVSAGSGDSNNKNNEDLYAADQPYFYPAFEETKVRIDAVEQITGTPAFKEIYLHEAYYKHGIAGSQNKGQVFAMLKEEVGLSFSANADKAGGLATPNMNIGGLSRSLGTVGGKIEDAVSGKFDPTSFFDEALDANLLGGISLRDIIDAVNDFGGDLIKIPRMLNQKNFENPKAMLSSLQSLASAVNDVKNDVEKFKQMKDELDDAIGDIESLPDAIDEAAQDIAEQARQKALGIIQEVEKEVKGIINQAAGYAQSVMDKIKSIAESDSLAGLLESLGLPTELTLELKWGPTIKSWPNSDQPNDLMGSNALFQALNAAGNPVEKSDEVIFIRAALTVKLDGSAPSFVLEGIANNFEIRLVPIKDAAPEGFVHLKFDDLSFRSKDAAKPDVNVEFNPDTGITFHGPLAFVEKIREFIPFDGFSDPPSLDVSPTGITAGFTLPLPTIAVGVFSLQNISLGASLELPFTNSPIVFTFMFCTRENPFMLTISMLGGGGYFGLIISTKEIGFEAALEFGGSFAFDIGVASGGVYIKAGVYYKKMGEEVILEGYLKLGGSLEVLGIITISVDFYMSLTYQEPGGKVIGQATLTVKIEILFFSVSVELHVERRFKGSANDPLFIDLMKQNHWDEYCDAFAAIA